MLSNIYLDRLDAYVEDKLIPQFTSGNARKRNPKYRQLEWLLGIVKKARDWETWTRLRREMRSLPSYDTQDPNFRRLRYVRYADDFLLGFTGPRCEAEAIKTAIREFLAAELRLELSDAKTLITHGRTEKARFLGYEVCVSHCDSKVAAGQRSVNGKIALLVPREVVMAKRKTYMRRGKVVHRPELLEDDDLSIISLYQAQWRGLLNYYLMAVNVSARLSQVYRAMRISLAKTLAAKHRLTLSQVFRVYGATAWTLHGDLKVLRAIRDRPGKEPLVAEFGGLEVRWRKEVPNCDPPTTVNWNPRSELVKRLLADVCELCGSTGDCEVHHIRKLSDIDRPGRRAKTAWEQIMIARRRKTLVLCRKCHRAVDNGKYDGPSITTPESRVP